MPTASVPGLTVGVKLGKYRQRSQMCRIYTVDGRVETTELSVSRSCIRIPDIAGFMLSPPNQFRDKQNISWQLLYESSCIPIDLREDIDIKDLTKIIDQIYADNTEEAKRKQFKEAMKSKWLDKIMWIVLMVCITVGIIGLTAYLRS
jgi:hypothetical protein